MSTLRITAGVGVGFSGARGLPSGWRVRKPLPCTLRFSVKPALFFLLVRVALKLRSLRLHPPRLCRLVVF